MGQRGGPNIPIDGVRLIFDPRNPIVSIGNYISAIDNYIGTATGAILAGSGYTVGINFASLTDKISFSDISSLNLTASITVMGWIYPRSFGGGSSGRIYDKFKTTFPQSGFALWIDNSIGTNAIVYGTGWAVSTTVGRLSNQVSLNTWQHFAAVHSGTTVTFYKNGSSIGSSGSITAPTSASGVAACIGNNSAGTNNFDGTLGAVRVYNRVLSAKDILQVYNSTKSRYGL
jgi:hypothetical protein